LNIKRVISTKKITGGKTKLAYFAGGKSLLTLVFLIKNNTWGY
jgi:hypothetical protein